MDAKMKQKEARQTSPGGRRGDAEVAAFGPALIRPREAAELLAISPRKLWELTNRREIPCVRIGRAVRYDPAALQAWIKKAKRRG